MDEIKNKVGISSKLKRILEKIKNVNPLSKDVLDKEHLLDKYIDINIVGNDVLLNINGVRFSIIRGLKYAYDENINMDSYKPSIKDFLYYSVTGHFLGNIKGRYKIYKSRSIHRVYNENVKNTCGSLSSSCMKGKEKEYFKIYDNACRILTFKVDKIENEYFKTRVVSRCLLWDIGGKTYFDRIYSRNYVDESIELSEYVIDVKTTIYCLSKGFIPLSQKNCLKPEPKYLEVPIDFTQISEFPYIDSFSFADIENGLLKTSPDPNTTFRASSTEGELITYCPNCERSAGAYLLFNRKIDNHSYSVCEHCYENDRYHHNKTYLKNQQYYSSEDPMNHYRPNNEEYKKLLNEGFVTNYDNFLELTRYCQTPYFNYTGYKKLIHENVF